MGGAIILFGLPLEFCSSWIPGLGHVFAVWWVLKKRKTVTLVPNQQNESSSRNNLVDGLKLIASKEYF